MRQIVSFRHLLCSLSVGAALWSGGPAVAQNQPAQPQPAQPGGEERPDWQKRMDDFRKRADDRMKTLLQASDEEYAVLKPRIEKLQGLQMANDSRMFGFGMLMGGGAQQTWRTRGSEVPEGQRAERKPEEGAAPARPTGAAGGLMAMFGVQNNATLEKAREIQQILESKEATPDLLKSKLAELRALKKQSKEDITRAQEELRQLCSVRQETVLVLMGLLE